MDAEQVYDLRTQTKMELLKEHLKVNIGDDFNYSPKKFLERLGRTMARAAEESVEETKVQP